MPLRTLVGVGGEMRRIVLVLLLLAVSPLWSAIGTDVTVSTDRSSSSITAPSFSTTSPNESLPSYGACDNPIVRTLGPNQTVGQQYYLASLVPGLGAGGISAALRTHRHTISGSITSGTNGAGATVTLSGAASATTTADANGNYSFAGLANGSYTVTPSKAGFTFSPASTAVTINGANQTANFTASAVSYSISGTITNGAGATVTLTGAAARPLPQTPTAITVSPGWRMAVIRLRPAKRASSSALLPDCGISAEATRRRTSAQLKRGRSPA